MSARESRSGGGSLVGELGRRLGLLRRPSTALDANSFTGLSLTLSISPDTLRKFAPFAQIGGDDLVFLASQAQVFAVPRNEVIIRRGDNDPWTFFLLEGTVNFEAGDGRGAELTAGSERASAPLAALKPRQFTVRAATNTRLLRFEDDLVARYRRQEAVAGYEVEEHVAHPRDEPGSPLRHKVEALIDGDALRLPSLARSTARLGRVVAGQIGDAADVARMLSHDVAVTAKIVRDAGAMAGAVAPAETCGEAVRRLGTAGVCERVRRYVNDDLYRTEYPILKERMVEHWRHSRGVSAVCFVLSRRLGVLDPDHARLAGLVHDIGVLPVLIYAESDPALAGDPRRLEEAVAKLREPMGERLLRRYRFPEYCVGAALDAENWMREGDGLPDYADLVIAAQLHTLMAGAALPPALSPLDRLPVFRRLGMAGLDPRFSIEIIAQARDDILEVKERQERGVAAAG